MSYDDLKILKQVLKEGCDNFNCKMCPLRIMNAASVFQCISAEEKEHIFNTTSYQDYTREKIRTAYKKLKIKYLTKL